MRILLKGIEMKAMLVKDITLDINVMSYIDVGNLLDEIVNYHKYRGEQ